MDRQQIQQQSPLRQNDSKHVLHVSKPIQRRRRTKSKTLQQPKINSILHKKPNNHTFEVLPLVLQMFQNKIIT